MNENDQPSNLNKESEYVTNLEELPQPQLDGHMWRQEGNMLICRSCPFKHMNFIEPGYQLYGIDDDGLPMIRKIEVSDGE